VQLDQRYLLGAVTIHYHGTPITPREVLLTLAGRHFCVSFSEPRDALATHQIGQSVMLDNGAFSAWTQGKETDWPGYYAWADQWLDYPTTWAVVPDVIGGDEQQNQALMLQWPFGRTKGAPVWHMHESIDWLLALTDSWPRVCFGSSGRYAVIGTPQWHSRMTEAWNEIAKRYKRTPNIHMLRGSALAGGPYPFASVDSTNIARNHNRNSVTESARHMADRIDALQCPARWTAAAVQTELI
jgi:hypothetical protein